MPTLALEATREGIDDARYLHVLPSTARSEPVRDIEPFSISIPTYLERWDGQVFETRRWQIARRALTGRRKPD
ncbi:MAG: hypothetical protein ACUVTZ_04770 [Armatimonadota bacterium]